MHKVLLLPVVVSILTFCAGCGGGGGRVPVSGFVRLDGQPLPGVQITFDQPELPPSQNTAYIGRTDAEGRFSLQPAMGEGAGIPPGKYRVSMTTAVHDPNNPPPPPQQQSRSMVFFPEEAPPPPEKIPPKYRVQEFEVPADGTEEANFEVKSR